MIADVFNFPPPSPEEAGVSYLVILRWVGLAGSRVKRRLGVRPRAVLAHERHPAGGVGGGGGTALLRACGILQRLGGVH